MSKSDKRGSRFEFSQFPWVFSLQLADPGTQEHPLRVEARNISRSGMKFQSNWKIPLFEQVQIVLFDKKSGKELASLFAKVVRLEEVDTGFGERTYGVAVEFVSGSAELANLIPDSPPSPQTPV